MDREAILIEVKDLRKYFPMGKGVFSRSRDYVKAVDGVDLFIRRGETLALVGESGCGKTTLGRAIIRLIEPTSGEVFFEGENILNLRHEKLRTVRQKMQIIFQDPYFSLDPRQSVGSIISEPFVIHDIGNRKEREKRVVNLMEMVGLSPDHYTRYPHEFSGGQRQRIGIARALALQPEFIVCDEPVSALDVSIQAQVINVLKGLQERFSLTYLFISHDLSVVKHVSDRVAVMYLGRVVELASKAGLYKSSYHPYTEALLSASPIPDPEVERERIILEGDVPSAINPPRGCHFNPRCPYVGDKCRDDPPPPLEEIRGGHWVKCWRARERRGI